MAWKLEGRVVKGSQQKMGPMTIAKKDESPVNNG